MVKEQGATGSSCFRGTFSMRKIKHQSRLPKEVVEPTFTYSTLFLAEP